MKKTTILVMITTVLLVIALSIAGKTWFRVNTDFNYDNLKYDYNFAKVFVEATSEIRESNFLDAMTHMAGHNLEPDIEKLHEIIDERLLSLKVWEKKFFTVFEEPYNDIEDVIALEYVYYLSKIGYHEKVEIDSEEWYSLGLLYLPVGIRAKDAPRQSVEYKEYLDNPTILYGFFIRNQELKDRTVAYLGWMRVEKKQKHILMTREFLMKKRNGC